ncbi:type 1 phosphatidylinositol 4,5-bisphosphate 4-phosphatase-like [Amphiura filiformis]|uniref:type 1 phosphatidylinositol 4,5-bisphosphate 4-phosphatase-like n=1 Tax=Amphiura filiformis TaxID=82378 RepID=UPI003B20CE47
MADRREESEPLLSNQEESVPTGPIIPNVPEITDPDLPPPPLGSIPPPILPGEQPPPYSPTTSPQGGVPMINCRVCQSMINLEGRLHQHVVKCGVCHEATPIKDAPPGKKYVRCPCNCLLICKASSKRIACPRANCKRIINLTPTVMSSSTVATLSGHRVVCGHCNERFRFPHTSTLARCPYCRKVSSVGPSYARTRCIIYAIIGIIFLAAGVGVTIGTYELARDQGGIYFVWIGAFVIGLLNLLRSCYYGSMKVSSLEMD